MNQILRLHLIFLCCFASFPGPAQTICSSESRQKLEDVMAQLSEAELMGKTPNELIQEIAPRFINTSYVEKTLEIPGPEQLVINLQGLDCTTYLETVVSLARIAERQELNFEAFARELENIRYRTGSNEGYPSRLHYFSDWIAVNQEKNILKDITQEIGGIPYENRPTFMTENPQFYPQLSNQENVERLQNIEAAIGLRKYYFIPKDQISLVESQIRSGDLIAITTSMKNLDIVHVGFAMEKNARIHLMHASSKNKKVELSEKPLADYLAENKSQSGIMVMRLN